MSTFILQLHEILLLLFCFDKINLTYDTQLFNSSFYVSFKSYNCNVYLIIKEEDL